MASTALPGPLKCLVKSINDVVKHTDNAGDVINSGNVFYTVSHKNGANLFLSVTS